MPSSSGAASATAPLAGAADADQMLQGQLRGRTVELVPTAADSRALSSTERAWTVSGPGCGRREGVAPRRCARRPGATSCRRRPRPRPRRRSRRRRWRSRHGAGVPTPTSGRSAASTVVVGAAVSVLWLARDQVGLQRRRLHAHVGEEVDRGLLHGAVGPVRAAAVGVLVVQTPRPLHRAGAEDQRTAGGPVQASAWWLRRAGRVARTVVVLQDSGSATSDGGLGQLRQAGRRLAVVELAVPLVAERPRTEA